MLVRCQGSPTYGYITSTPKPGWNMVDVVGYLSDGSVPCKFDTDVNAPALAEYMVRHIGRWPLEKTRMVSF